MPKITMPSSESFHIITGEDLLFLIEKNDKPAFTEFYLEKFQQLILVADKYVKDIAVAEEIVQDIFLRIWEDKELLLSIKSIKAYLYRSVVNASLNFVSRQKNIERHNKILADDLTEEDIETLDVQNELIVLLYNEIELLPEKCRQVFKMSRLEGLKYKEIAFKLGVAEKTVENHMANAFRILRAKMLDHAKKDPRVNKVKYISLISFFLY